MGINTHDGRPSFVAAADQLGVTWVRFDAHWFVLEPAQDAYQWATLDAQVDAAHAAGLKVFLTLAYTPAWVPRHGDSNGQPRNDVPNTSAEWVDFVRDAVSHYRARGVQHFGLWNEANLQNFFEGTVDEYANILVNPGAAAVRAVCADCYVLGLDLAHVGDVDGYLEQTLARTAGAWHIITHHTYNGFRETGWRIWDGDGFLNALELQRFSITRRAEAGIGCRGLHGRGLSHRDGPPAARRGSAALPMTFASSRPSPRFSPSSRTTPRPSARNLTCSVGMASTMIAMAA